MNGDYVAGLGFRGIDWTPTPWGSDSKDWRREWLDEGRVPGIIERMADESADFSDFEKMAHFGVVSMSDETPSVDEIMARGRAYRASVRSMMARLLAAYPIGHVVSLDCVRG